MQDLTHLQQGADELDYFDLTTFKVYVDELHQKRHEERVHKVQEEAKLLNLTVHDNNGKKPRRGRKPKHHETTN